MSTERSAPFGDVIGYQAALREAIRPCRRAFSSSRRESCSGIHHDPFLESTAAVVFDEFHERSLENDLALGMVRLVQQTVRPDLRIVVMSATLAVGALQSIWAVVRWSSVKVDCTRSNL